MAECVSLRAIPSLAFQPSAAVFLEHMSEPSIEYYNAAIDAVQAGKLDEALTAVENSLTEDPKDGETWRLYIVVLNALGRTRDAESATSKLKEMGLSEVDELLLKAVEEAGAGNMTGAASYYGAALKLEQNRPEIHVGYALALLECGDSDTALAAAQTGVALAPDDSHANYALGHVLRLAGSREDALTALSKSVSADPEFMIAVYEEGMLLAETGQLTKALGNFQKFLKIHPGDASAMEAVENIKEAMNGAGQ